MTRATPATPTATPTAPATPDRAHEVAPSEPTGRIKWRSQGRPGAPNGALRGDRAQEVALPDPGLTLVLDPDRLSTLVGEPVRATRVRPKAGVTHVAALVAPDGELRGWVRTLQGEARLKADKMSRQVARRCGIELGRAELPGADVLVLWGPAATDPPLSRDLGRVRKAATKAGLPVDAQVLRYNPGRRLVVRQGDVVHRITATDHRERLTSLTTALLAAGVPVTTPLATQRVRSDKVTAWPWVPGRDAAAVDDPAVLREVGRLLRRLHEVPSQVVPGLEVRGWPEVVQTAQTSLRQLLEVLPLTPDDPGTEMAGRDALHATAAELTHLAHRAADLLAADHVPEAPELVVSHGDFSLDQCLVREDGELLLTDFDRAVLAPREFDLASLAAADLVEGRSGADHVLEGYGGAEPELGPWTGAALLSRVTQPWRMQITNWRQETTRILQAAVAALDTAALAISANRAPAPALGSAALVPAVVVPERVGSGEDEIEVARAWPGRPPKGADQGRVFSVAVEGRDGRGRLRAGTWTISRSHVSGSGQASPHHVDGGSADLLPWARDPKLPGLAALAARLDQQERLDLVVHRPGRRAVVRMADAYAKVVRPGRVEGVAAAGRVGHDLARRAGLAAPAVVGVEGDVVLLATVPGRPLHDLGGDPGWESAWTRWHGAWTRLQALPHTGIDLPVHTWADEADGLRGWADKAAPLLVGTPWVARLHAVADELAAAPVTRLVPTHRDLHDKQLLWDGQDLAVLDLDTACLAHAAVDPANLAVHADLRAAQGVWSDADAAVVRRHARDVAGAAGVPDREWELARRATLVRLVAVYAFRPRWRATVLAWATAADTL